MIAAGRAPSARLLELDQGRAVGGELARRADPQRVTGDPVDGRRALAPLSQPLWRRAWPLDAPGAVLRGGAVLAFARLVHLVGALACPLAAGAGAVPGGVQLVGNLRP